MFNAFRKSFYKTLKKLSVHTQNMVKDILNVRDILVQ